MSKMIVIILLTLLCSYPTREFYSSGKLKSIVWGWSWIRFLLALGVYILTRSV